MRNFKINEEDFWKIKKMTTNISTRRVVGVVIFVVVVMSGMVSFHMKPDVNGLLSLLIWLAVMSGLIIIFIPKYIANGFKKEYDSRRKAFEEEIVINFDEKRIEFVSVKDSHRCEWTDILKIKESDSLIIIYENEYIIRAIKKEAFESDAEQEQFYQYIESSRMVISK